MSFMTAAEGPVVLPIGKIGETELSAVLPSEKALILLAIAIQVIWALLNYIFKRREKEEDKSEEKLDRLYVMVHAMQADVKALKDAPTEDDMIKRLTPFIELQIYKAIHKPTNGRKA